jgi:hypothetical protein
LIYDKQQIITKDKIMKKKLLVLLIAASSTLMPNLASAVAFDVGGLDCVFCIGIYY